jgi:hypothetical protein
MATNTAARVWRIGTVLAAGFVAGTAVGFAAGLFEPHRRAASKPDSAARMRPPQEAAGVELLLTNIGSARSPVPGPLDSAPTGRSAVG